MNFGWTPTSLPSSVSAHFFVTFAIIVHLGHITSIMTVSVVHPRGTQDGRERGLRGTTERPSSSSVETLGSLLILVEVEE